MLFMQPVQTLVWIKLCLLVMNILSRSWGDLSRHGSGMLQAAPTLPRESTFAVRQSAATVRICCTMRR